MRFMPFLDKTAYAIQRRIMPRPALTAETLGHPLFCERIRARRQRWWFDGEDHPSKKLCPKLGGQDFVRSLGYPLPELYALYPHITALPDLSTLPKRFVLKPVNSSGVTNVFLMKDGISQFDRKPMTREDVIAAVGPDCQSAFMAEEMLMHHDGRDRAANDVKFYIFGSHIAYIVMVERNNPDEPSQNRYWFMTEDWQRLRMRVSPTTFHERRLPPMPACYPEMRDIVRDIGQRLNTFVRLDMYATTRGPVFGEFTHFPNGGRDNTPQADAWLGSLWKGPEGCEPLPDAAEAEPLRISA